MKLSPKQMNVVHYRRSDVAMNCGYDVHDALLHILDRDLDPYDANAIIGSVFDLGKNELEGMTPELKKKIAEELTEIVGRYSKCPRCRKVKVVSAGICSDCYGEIGDDSYRSVEALKATLDE